MNDYQKIPLNTKGHLSLNSFLLTNLSLNFSPCRHPWYFKLKWYNCLLGSLFTLLSKSLNKRNFMKKFSVFLLIAFSSTFTAQLPFFPPLPNYGLFVLIAIHFKNHQLPSSELEATIRQATEEKRTTKDWLGIISNKTASLPSKGHTPVTYLAAHTHRLKRRG